MENRIKEPPLGLFADRTRCGGWWANQFRLLLSRCGYVPLERLRALGFKGTNWRGASGHDSLETLEDWRGGAATPGG